MNCTRIRLSLQQHERLLGLAVGLVAIVSLVAWCWVPASFDGQPCELSGNGAWVSVDWTSEPPNSTAIQHLAENASTFNLRYLYPFAAYVQKDGTFTTSYEYAAEFVLEFRQFNQGTKLLAWIGVPVLNPRRLGPDGWVDLGDEMERTKIVNFAKNLLKVGKFDGIHLDVEHINDGDAGFLALLDEMKVAIGPDHLVSAAANDWQPTTVNYLPVLGRYKWSGNYFKKVSERVDQITVMTYDSFLPTGWLYRLWLREQVRGLSRNLAHSPAELLIGVSVSREHTSTHDPRAENLINGLAGTCAALISSSEARRVVDGIAIYASWEATESDWKTWSSWVDR